MKGRMLPETRKSLLFGRLKNKKDIFRGTTKGVDGFCVMVEN